MLNRRASSENIPHGSGDRLLAVLGLFTAERTQWSVEAAAERLAVSTTTTYRYFKKLTKAGLISPVAGAGYTLGPAIVQMDRLIQSSDPMLRGARAVMIDLVSHAAEGSTVLLCRLFHDRVMCVHQIMGRGPQEPVSYERGRLMPLYRGATSKIILAHLPPRTLKTLFAHDAAEIAAAGLGAGWEEFRRGLAAIRRAGVSVSRGEIDAGRVGVAAPLFDKERAVLGSLSVALPAQHADDALVERLVPLTVAGAREIERTMNSASGLGQPSPARVKITRPRHAFGRTP
ncbi:MAG TPA: IclR family transcriptional regulator [Xanthobacteraceae bacterium]|jgi:DNA-binding IclR family transcriptional regulator|nr:IclR family transcriptional regulator [Xanthobacteraceae bacterium]